MKSFVGCIGNAPPLSLYRSVTKNSRNVPQFFFSNQSPPRKRRDDRLGRIAQLMVDRFMLEGGAKAIRSNSFYVTDNISRAAERGTVYHFYPHEESCFSYFEGVSDLYSNLETWLEGISHRPFEGAMKRAILAINSSPDMLDVYTRRCKVGKTVIDLMKSEWLPTLKLRTDNLQHGLDTNSEIMVHGRYDMELAVTSAEEIADRGPDWIDQLAAASAISTPQSWHVGANVGAFE